MTKTKIYYTILFFFYFSFNAMGNTDSLEYRMISDFGKLIEMGDSLVLHKKNKQALNVFLKTLEIAEEKETDSLHEISHFKLLNTNFHLKKYVDVIYHANEFDYYATEKISERQAKVKKIISDVYRETGQWDKAKDYMKKSLYIWNQLDDLGQKREVNYQYCSTIFYSGLFDDALLCYDVFLNEVELERDTYNIVRSKIAIGACYSRIENYEQSIPYLLAASTMLESKQDKNSIRLKGYLHHNLGNHYYSTNKFEKALEQTKKAVFYREKEKSRNTGLTFSLISKIYAAIGDEEGMNLYLTKSETIANALNSDVLFNQIYKIRKNHALEKEDYKTAYGELEKIKALDEKKYKKGIEGAMVREMAKSAVNKKELEITNLKQEKEYKEQQRLNLTFILTLLISLLIGSLYFIHRLRKVNEELASKNQVIEKQKEELEISNKDLEQFAYIASHDLKEPVRTIGSYASLLNRRYKNELGESGAEFVDFIKQASVRMNFLLSDLLHYSRLNTHEFVKTDVDMNNILIMVEENLYQAFKNNNVRLEVSKLPLIKANNIQMVRMFQNLIKNGVVYNKSEEKTIKVWAEEGEKNWTFFVKDNGIGIAPEYQEKVFEIFKRLHSKDKYDGSGIGLSSCQKIVMMHGGKIKLKSELGEGTTFYFTIPKE